MKNGIDAIRDVLIRFPYGIKARVIASYIPAMDKKSVNQILYGNPAIFFCRNYLWFLKKPVEEQSKVSIRKPTKKALSSLTAPVNIQEKTDVVAAAEREWQQRQEAHYERLLHPERKLQPSSARLDCIANCSTCTREHCILEKR